MIPVHYENIKLSYPTEYTRTEIYNKPKHVR